MGVAGESLGMTPQVVKVIGVIGCEDLWEN